MRSEEEIRAELQRIITIWKREGRYTHDPALLRRFTLEWVLNDKGEK